MIAATAPALPFPRFVVRPYTITHQRRSCRPHRLHLDPIFNILSKIRTLGQESPRDPFIFINLRTLGETCVRWSAASVVFRLPTYSTESLYFHFRYVGISPMFSTRCGLFTTFCNRLSLFSTPCGLFWQKHRGGSMTNLISTPKRSTPKEESPEPPGGRQSGAWGLTARTGR
jgi:hypothetical protein